MMESWSGKRVIVIGAARQGTALARYLVRQGAQVTLNDRRSQAELAEVKTSLQRETVDLPGELRFAFGGHSLELLDRAELLCLSGGIPLDLGIVREALARRIPLSNDSQVFLEAAPCRVIGITGSAGKTTTTTLVGRMSEAASAGQGVSWKAYVGGNIGDPLINHLEAMTPQDLAVMELSSFQLEIMDRSPQIATLLNVTPNHLDRHSSMEAYTEAKARILVFQRSDDLAVLGRDDPGAWAMREKVKGRLISFGEGPLELDESGTYLNGEAVYYRDPGQDKLLLPCSLVALRGRHNLQNVLAACAVAVAAGFGAEAIQAGVEGFTGVAHRLEFVREWRGAHWYNDSIATAPERAIAAIRSFEEPLILLAGGRDKNLPWQDFAALVRQRVEHLVLFGDAAKKIAASVQEAGGMPGMVECAGLEEAVRTAAKLAKPGWVVLLSPGGTSFDEFRDFEDRGEAFKKWVMELR
jgi:UDP-N-acetylmuramoylalanine--D-glutamate ligase